MLCALCHRLYPAHYRRISGSRSSNFAKMLCQTLQIAQLSSSRACSLPTTPVHGTAGWTQPGSSSSKKNKSSFLCWAYSSAGSGLWAIPAHAAQRLISLAWEKKENKHSVGESDRSNICWWQWLLTVLKCSWTSLCPKKNPKNKLKAESSFEQKQDTKCLCKTNSQITP